MNIRPANLSDTPFIHEMVNAMYSELNYGISFNESWVTGRLKSRLFMSFVCENENGAAGFCTIKITKDEYGQAGNMAFLYELYVKPESRKSGNAAKLLAYVERELKELEINYIELYVHINNSGGYDFWKAQGFFDKYHVLGKKL
ncbi:GNAT family N-acetyltransferase [Tyzzerella sp. OttesenSCG-928-J15]|nr:GNAT family N-acetyltransferase [Tyzzerella sp. OttesenSCG-928-J15]